MARTPRWEPDDGVEVEVLEKLSLDPGTDAVAEEDAVRDDHAAPPAFQAAHGTAELAHDELEKQEGGLGGLLVLREVRENPPLFLAAERRFVMITSHGPGRRFRAGGNGGRCRDRSRIFEAVQEKIHLAQKVRQGFGLDAVERSLLEPGIILRLPALLLQVLVGFDRNPPVPAQGRARSPELRIDHRDDELDDRARGVELA